MNYTTLYRQMLLIRTFEEKAAELYTEGYITGFCHLYIGQEAVVVKGAIGLMKFCEDVEEIYGI